MIELSNLSNLFLIFMENLLKVVVLTSTQTNQINIEK